MRYIRFARKKKKKSKNNDWRIEVRSAPGSRHYMERFECEENGRRKLKLSGKFYSSAGDRKLFQLLSFYKACTFPCTGARERGRERRGAARRRQKAVFYGNPMRVSHTFCVHVIRFSSRALRQKFTLENIVYVGTIESLYFRRKNDIEFFN